jgi:hypothetical protein
MTNTIKELMIRAGVDDNPDREGIEIFAELIVQECLSIARAGLADAVVDVIKEKFGVE